jgi:signal recognition particle subunit SRP54
MLERLGEVLRKATDKIANTLFVDKNLIDSVIRDLQRALIEADVNVVLVKQLSDKIKKESMNERIKGVEKKEHLIKLLHDELLHILGEQKQLKLQKEQNRIMLLGLYGAGKTTTIAKIGNYFAKRGNKVALVGLDVHRPAAPEQLKQLAEKHNLSCFIDPSQKDPLKIWKKYKKELEGYNLVLFDTAGRHTLDKELIKEIKLLNKEIQPTESILIMPADIGQAAKQQAQEFSEAMNLSGVIITRMDSTAKAGGALTAAAEAKAPVYFIGTGEKINDLEEFNPKSFLSRLLGMGDLESLIQKIKSVTNEDAQKATQKRIEEGKLSLEDVIEQVKSMSSLGGFEKIKGMIPGFSAIKDKIPEGMIEGQEGKIAKWEHILKSMTPEEKENPELLEKQTSRISRVAKGAGVSSSDVRALLKQYKMLNEMVSSGSTMDMSQGISQKQMMKLAKKFGKGKKLGF